ncbi:transcriptional regulator family: Fungal Specific TF [Penicillium frequentans]|uniref:Transcriptional regulator family: Fungal Specific TF n=1 Tax=Penicillium frequentans TaxID=3151616 RepID=A0AAD6GLE6_9EURO|nr:transcriptional regulator family: Fungal Specific TF [Penicillium glabrum]
MDKCPKSNHQRKRASRACDRCRSQRSKCDGARPSCTSCQKSGQACMYNSYVKKRGLPEGYVRGLEKLFALSVCNIEGFEDKVLRMLESSARSKTSRLFGELKELLHISDVLPTSAKGKGTQNFLDNAENQQSFKVVTDSAASNADIIGVIVASSSLVNPKARVSQVSNCLNNGIYTTRLPPQVSQMLETYFAVAHPWFPIVTKHNILRLSCLHANDFIPQVAASPGSGDHAVLWAILSYTVTHSLASARVRGAGALSFAREYYAVSRNLIPSENEHYELSHVQALLLLTLVNMGLEDWTAARLLIDQAARMAIAMGLGTPSGTSHSIGPGQEMTVFLACFVIDSLLSFRLSHLPSMHPIDLAVIDLLEDEEPEDWGFCKDGVLPLQHLLASRCFNRLVELAQILNKISRNVWTGSQPANLAHNFLVDLKGLKECLPRECTSNEAESSHSAQRMALLPYESYFCLTHIATLLWLYLRLIPGEQGLHPLQRPAVDGALRLLAQSLSIISQQSEDFPFWDFPPLLEVVLRTIVEQSLMLRHAIEPSDISFFGWWFDELRQKILTISPTWPAYSSLAYAMERWQQSQGHN